MNTARTLARACDPFTLAALRDGTADLETRKAFALGLLAAQRESLRACELKTQLDMFAAAAEGIRPSAAQTELF